MLPLHKKKDDEKDRKTTKLAPSHYLYCRFITLACRLGLALIFPLNRLLLALNGRRLVAILSINILRSLGVLSLNIGMWWGIDIIIDLLPVGVYETGSYFVASVELDLSLLLQGVNLFLVQDVTVLVPVLHTLLGAEDDWLFGLRSDAFFGDSFLLLSLVGWDGGHGSSPGVTNAHT